jgi:hypothetical protein
VKLRGSPAPPGAPEEYIRRHNEFILRASFAMMWITPQMAREWLERYNTRNRRLTPSASRKLREKIAQLLWCCNGESIVFDWHGILLNGQHRLDAIASGKVPVPVLVVFGVDPAAFATYDQPKKRNNADILGLLDHVNCTTLQSALGWAVADSEGKIAGHGSDQIPNESVASWLDLFPGLIESANWSAQNKTRLAPGGLLAYLHWRFSSHAPEHTVDFFEKTILGVGVKRPSWEKSLRNRLEGDLAGRRTKPDQVMIAALFIKAFNRVLFQEPCVTSLRGTKEVEPFITWKSDVERFPELASGPFPPREQE